MIFAYIKTLDNVHKASPCIICLGKESMLCVCGCSSANYCLLRGWISTCPGLCVLWQIIFLEAMMSSQDTYQIRLRIHCF